MMNQVISTHRLMPFIGYKLTLNYKTWLIQLLAYTGIFTLITGIIIANSNDNISNSNYEEIYFLFYTVTLFACGLYITSRSFNELSGTSKGFLFMQLPVSVFEKFSIPALCTTVLFPILFTLFYILTAHLSNFIWSNVFNFEYYAYPLFRNEHASALRLFLMIQPLFLLGSIYFRKQHLLWSAISIASIIIVFISAWSAIGKHISTDDMYDHSFLGSGIQLFGPTLTKGDIIITLIVLASWVVGYFTLKEREV